MSKKLKVISAAEGIVLASTALAVMPASAGVNASNATSAASFGGIGNLIKAAKKEGTLNLIATPRDWANYGAAMDIMTKAFGIKIVSDNPDGSSAQEITAIRTTKNMEKMPDVVDIGLSYVASGAGLFANYRVQTWSDIPKAWKSPVGNWYGAYTGSIAMCYDATVTPAPTSIASLDNIAYKNMFAIQGDPTAAQQALISVFAVTVAKGGSVKNIQPGIDFFHKLKSQGIFVPVTANASAFASGSFKIMLTWDYNAPGFIALAKTIGKTVKCTYPKDALVAGTPYVLAINKTAPHPAAARLWEELMFSMKNGKLAEDLTAADLALPPAELFALVMGGQNVYISGGASPITSASMTDKVAPPTALTVPAGLPKSVLPSLAQQNVATAVLKTAWSKI
ncbi:MAG: ABC transporter substrate-binding protein [Streptomycetaceae bacterium]|nr:MAG: ABC transporter substrate-binding protein [Streptomycetaceae bacterium]